MITGYKAARNRPLTRGQKLSNKALAAVRAPVEHGFAHLKNWRVLGKVRTDWSAFAGQPMVSVGLKPVLTKGDPVRIAAWDRLSAGSARFRRAERGFTLAWGLSLVGECAARVVGAYTLPVSTMAWLSTVFLIGAFVVAFIAGAPFHNRIEKLVEAEAEAAVSGVAEHFETEDRDRCDRRGRRGFRHR